MGLRIRMYGLGFRVQGLQGLLIAPVSYAFMGYSGKSKEKNGKRGYTGRL